MGMLFLLRLVEEDGNAFTQLSANALVVSLQVIGAKLRATERRLEGVNIVDLEILPDCDARSAFLILLDIEAAVLVPIRLM